MLAMLCATAGRALASASLTDATASIVAGPGRPGFADTALLVTFREAGLAPGEQARLTLHATAQATYGCRAPDGRIARARALRYTHPPEVSQFSQTFTAGPTGTVEDRFLEPEADLASGIADVVESGAFSCPRRDTLVRRAISYRDISVADEARGLSIAVPGALTLRAAAIPERLRPRVHAWRQGPSTRRRG